MADRRGAGRPLCWSSWELRLLLKR